MNLGERILERRKELGLSLRDLAQQVDLTASFLSQVERNLASPSIDSLRRISDALGIPIFYFLMEEQPKSPVVRHNQRNKFSIPHLGLSYELLTPSLNKKMEIFITELAPDEENAQILSGQVTEECIYVLEGLLEVQLSDGAYTLEPGDTIYFEGVMLQHLRGRGDKTIKFISIITPPIF